jgi:hypothetical protein
MAGYSNRSLRDKLGLRDGMKAAVLDAPLSVLREIDSKSEAATELSQTTYEFIHGFFTSSEKLRLQLPLLKEHLAKDGMLWISWKKKSADPQGELNESLVRELGLAAGLVDVKVCAVDESWSGLKFVYRLADRK